MPTMREYLLPFADALADARKHARATYPHESCGIVVSGRYIACENHARDAGEHTGQPGCRCTLCSFVIPVETYAKYARSIQLVVHSHPNGPPVPSRADMVAQEQMNVTWVILTLDETRDGPLVGWGGDAPIEDVIGREFIHGVSDCYNLIRDVFALGRDRLAEQGIAGWPHPPVSLPLYPRDETWWDGEDNFYEEKPQTIGFREVSRGEVQPGDVFFARIRSPKLNHGGVLVGDNLILHHLPQRLSRREPAGLWARVAEKWMRYEGPTA